MTYYNITKFFRPLISAAVCCFMLVSCRNKPMEGMIILTRSHANPGDRDFVTGDSWRYITESQIISINPNKPDNKPEELTTNFYSARSPEISFDGKSMIFAGQKTPGDPWQIWEMKLGNRNVKQITSSKENCIDPAYLPGGRIVFSMLKYNDPIKSGHSLYSCNNDGSDLRRVTYNPHTFFASGVLKDGRILSISKQVYPIQKKQCLFVLRPDGTKADLFYGLNETGFLLSRPWETDNGKIVFAESDSAAPEKGKLISINYNRPLFSKVNLSKGTEGDFCYVSPEISGRYLVSYRKSPSDRYSLCEFDPASGTIISTIFRNPEYNVLEAVVVRTRTRPKKLPSEVDIQVKTGLIMCEDINIKDPAIKDKISQMLKAKSIEILGIDSSLGITDVEKDGSFYLKVKADQPFRIQALDENGKVINDPCDWLWLRPNERRGCVGCHEDHEMTPENRIPAAVKKSPVTLPVHIVKLKEKTVELE